MIAEVPIVDESEPVQEEVEAPEMEVEIQEPPPVEVVVEIEKPKRPKRAPRAKAAPKPKAEPRARTPDPLQPVVLDRFASLSSTELVAELLHRRSHHERENKRLLYRSFLS